MTLPLALRWALRELRGGLRGFRVFLACLALGVAAIAAVGSLSAALQASLRENAQALLGGDVEATRSGRPLDATLVERLARGSTGVARVAEMRAMAYAGERNRTLVELKSVDDVYPLYGRAVLAPDLPLRAALGERDGRFGVAVEPLLLTRLGLALGESLRIGDAVFEVRATIVREPDRIASAFSFGPRVLASEDGLAATALVREGSLIRYRYRVRLAPDVDPEVFAAPLREMRAVGWNVRDTGEAQPGVGRFVERLAVFLSLVGVTALLIGGIGVGNAIANYLGGKRATIATMKCLGASGRMIFAVYFTQVMVLATVGIAIGIVIGAMAPQLANMMLAGELPLPAKAGFYAGPALAAALFGWLTAGLFALWPLARARDVPAAGLFRDIVAPTRQWPRAGYVAAAALLAAALAALAVFATGQAGIARWFVLGAAGTLLAFWLLSELLVLGVRRLGRPRRPLLRLALANMARPGSPTASVVVSLGAGLTVLVAGALIESNMARQIAERTPAVAPAFFFIDILPEQGSAFDATVEALAGPGSVTRVPMLRGRLSRIDGRMVDVVVVAPEAQWVTRSEIGFTYAAEMPPRTQITAGRWWPSDYAGPPLVSLDADIARGLGVGIGDTLTFSILGREITARIGNLRRIDWMDLGINFVTMFAPGTLEAAPRSELATARMAPAREEAVFRAVTDKFPNVSPIRVRDVADRIADLLGRIAAGVRGAAAIAVLAGCLVLAGAVASDYRRRVYEAVVLKVLGATRRDLAAAFLLEYVLLGLATGGVAVLAGTLTSWVVITEVMGADWQFAWAPSLATAVGGVVLAALFGFVGTWRALGQKAAPVLRSP